MALALGIGGALWVFLGRENKANPDGYSTVITGDPPSLEKPLRLLFNYGT